MSHHLGKNSSIISQGPWDLQASEEHCMFNPDLQVKSSSGRSGQHPLYLPLSLFKFVPITLYTVTQVGELTPARAKP